MPEHSITSGLRLASLVWVVVLVACGGGERTDAPEDTSPPTPDIPVLVDTIDGSKVDTAPSTDPDTGLAPDAVESWFCGPCSTETICGEGYVCTQLLDGEFCLPTCGPDRHCIDDARCEADEFGTALCFPNWDTCAGCPPGMAENACGGCAALNVAIGGPCGDCESGTWECDGVDAARCAGDRGSAARNACGGCTQLSVALRTPCGPCLDGQVMCAGSEATQCIGAGIDTDGDGVCDDADQCPGEDDRIDTDGDGIPDPCDECPLDRWNDSDGDGVCDSDDQCPGYDDTLDADGDGVPDACDQCLGFDDSIDTDGDGVPDACDCDATVCPVGSSCVSSPAGVSCPCLSGWTPVGDICVEIDECEEELADCHPVALCENIPGSYLCHCPTGWSGDGKTCTDVNECARFLDDCDDNARCDNTIGSYTCTCNMGYTGDGETCAIVNSATVSFPAHSDDFDVEGGGRSFAVEDDRVSGERSPNILSISKVTGVAPGILRNDIVSVGTGCFGVAAVELVINGQAFGILHIRENGTSTFEPAPNPFKVFGPPYNVTFETLGVLCGSFEFDDGGTTITVSQLP